MRNRWTPEEIFYILVRFLLCIFIIVCTIFLVDGYMEMERALETNFILGAMLNGLMGVRLWDEERALSHGLVISALILFVFAFI